MNFLKKLLVPVICIVSFVSYGQDQRIKNFDPEKLKPKEGHYYVDKNNVAIEGYDVVSYFAKNGPKKGMEKFSTTNDGVKYYFSSKSNKNSFVKNPEKYLPQYGGFCAIGVAKAKSKFAVDPETFKIIDGKLYLFFVGPVRNNWVNTKDSWNKDEEGNMKLAEANWALIKN